MKPKTESETVKVLDICTGITDDDVLLRRAAIFPAYRAITGATQDVCITQFPKMSANTLVQHPREQHLPREVKKLGVNYNHPAYSHSI